MKTTAKFTVQCRLNLLSSFPPKKFHIVNVGLVIVGLVIVGLALPAVSSVLTS
jgi:hypothetical protein